MSDGIRSGVNWMRLKLRSSAWASVLTISVFARPGTPIEQGVAAAEDRHQQLVEHLVLPDDDLADFLPQLLVGGAELLDHRNVVLHSRARSWGRDSGWGVQRAERGASGGLKDLSNHTRRTDAKD